MSKNEAFSGFFLFVDDNQMTLEASEFVKLI